MKPTTNIYILLDHSFYAKHNIESTRHLLVRYQRILQLSKHKTRLHFIKYNDKATFFEPQNFIPASGNPNLKAGLELLNTTISYQRQHEPYQTRSIFLLFGSSSALLGWKQALKPLYKAKEFVLGLRYAIATDNPRQYIPFTDRADRVVPYFSESRLLALVENLNRPQKAAI